MDEAHNDFTKFEEIRPLGNVSRIATNKYNDLIAKLDTRYEEIFNILSPYIAYGRGVSPDLGDIETQTQTAIESAIYKYNEKLISELQSSKEEAENILTEIRAVAAEGGVSQQASYFKEEADLQGKFAKYWLYTTYGSALLVAAFAVFSIFLHKFDWIDFENKGQLIQLISSKILIFTVLVYLLVLASRNYANHKHNAVINRHRQNALLTYRSLVSAAEQKGTQDIVLAHAAACIFSPQETGFAHAKGESTSGSKSVLELMTKATSKE